MIERWFPSAEVTQAAQAAWGRGMTEKSVFTWFAARPPAQAKAAVICSLLRWPDSVPEQERLQNLVRKAMTGRYEAWDELRVEIAASTGGDPSILDPFSGRGMIPLEAARLGITTYAVDYSHVAVLASRLLTEFPVRDWSGEPPLPFEPSGERLSTDPRLVRDVDTVLSEVGGRFESSVAEFFPEVDGKRPWAYLWAVTLPCEECGRRFPMIGSYELRRPSTKTAKKSGVSRRDPGQSFYIDVNDDDFDLVLHDGSPSQTPTLVNATDETGRKIPGKSAVCPFCRHHHPLATHRRMTNDGLGIDTLLIAVDLDADVGKRYRHPTNDELEAADIAQDALATEAPFTPLLPAVPDEPIAPGNNNIIGPSIYGCHTYGDLMGARQTLTFVRLARTIDALGEELRAAGLSDDYVRALTGYASSQMVRKIRYSSRGVSLHLTRQGVTDIFLNEGSIAYSYDFLEIGVGGGAGSWSSLIESGVRNVRTIVAEARGTPANVTRGSATLLTLADRSVAAVITDPPYDEMIAYADSSDVFYVWLKRALRQSWPELAITADRHQGQEKTDEIIVKRVRGEAPNEHRTREHYDRSILAAFAEMRRVVASDGVVTIVFGSGDPEVWQRLLSAMSAAELVMTGSWPASTESGGAQGKANIQTTLTMACRPAPAGRPTGRKGAVEAEIQREVASRYTDWERWGLAPADMLMAAAGPAMEVVGRYEAVLDSRAEPVDIYTFLPLARTAVQAAMAVEVNHRSLEAFDARTRFALWWVRLYGRHPQPKSELRWQVLASSIDLEQVRDLVHGDKAVAFVSSSVVKPRIHGDAAVIDVALALAAASQDGLEAMGDVLAASGRTAEDEFLWSAIKFLADRLADGDEDAIAFNRVLRVRSGVASAAESAAANVQEHFGQQELASRQGRLL